MDYREAWSFLNDLQFFKIKLGLDSMTAFLESLGNPQQGLRFVHVAGTNGKGSVCANLLSILAGAGYRVGLYTSPHLSSVRERFRINDEYISEGEFAKYASSICRILAGRQITYFEFTTALALLWFANRQVDLVLFEVGLGGRLDATNVVSPLVGVITNVAMDHEAYLGDTLLEIAAEKAGIIKPGVPVVSAVAEGVAREVVSSTCVAKGARLYLLGRDFQSMSQADGSWTYRGIDPKMSLAGLRNNLSGDYQQENSAVAVAAGELLGESGFKIDFSTIGPALSRVKWPGRLEQICLSEPGMEVIPGQVDQTAQGSTGYRRYLLDGAHNPAGVETLARFLAERLDYRDLVMVWASMSDKDFSSSLLRIIPLCRKIIFTRPEAERSATQDRLQKCLPVAFRERAQVANDVAGALDLARRLTDGRDLICVAGSLYLVGAARRHLLGDIV